jgi:glycosyltransferase EpsD
VGVDLTRFHPISLEEKTIIRKKLGYSMDDLLLIYPGEFSKRKNQLMLVKMLTYLKGRVNSFKLLLAGRGDFKFLEKISEELNVRTHIEFLGFKHDIEKFIQASDIALSSSYHEGLPINIVEAMACGKPVVCTNVRGNNDLIEHGQNGFLIKPDDEIEMARYIYELAQHPYIYDAMSKKAINKAQDYSLSNTVKSMDRIYKSYS